MPYKLEKRGDEYCVINTDTGESKGCSATRAKALGHMRALYAAAGAEEKTKALSDLWDLYGAQYSKTDVNYDAMGGTSDKACSGCRWFSSPDGCFIVNGDIAPNGVCDEFEVQPVYTPQPIQVQVVKEDEPSISLWDKAKEYIDGLFGRRPKQRSVILTKELDADGVERMRFIMPYTNNFEDRHGEIFESTSHKEYELFVDKYKSYPEVQLWHVDGSRWGQCDFVAYDEDAGFGYVSGLVDPGCEHIAKSLADDPDIGVSHRCHAIQIGNTVKAYYTWEVSPTPAKRAANVWHEGVKLLEDTMALPPEKRAWLVEHAGEDFVTNIEKDYEARAAQLKAEGIKSKEDSTEDIAESASGAVQPPQGAVEQVEGTPLTLESLQSVLQAVVDPLTERLDAFEEKQKSYENDLNAKAEELFGPRFGAPGFSASTSEKTKSDDEGQESANSWMRKSPGAFKVTEGVAE